jgi:hypothetical protein
LAAMSAVIERCAALSSSTSTRYTQPEPELALLLDQLKLDLPAQPAPKINAKTAPQASPCSADL